MMLSKRLLAVAALLGSVAAIAVVATDSLPKLNAAAPSASARLDKLPPEKRAFVNDPAQLARFNLTAEKLEIAVANLDDAAVDSYVTALMDAVASARFQKGRDMEGAGLNPKFPRFNGGMTLRPAILDTYQREPGPINLDRYVNQKTNIPTFARAPVAIRTADLVAGKVEVAFIGVPVDNSSGWRDAKHAPSFIRAMIGATGADAVTGINPNLVLRLADYGNSAVDNYAVERTVSHARVRVKEITAAGTVPFIVGGDHSVMYSGVAAVVDQYGKDNVKVILIDAHTEMQPGEHLISDNQSMRRLIQDGLVAPGNVTMVATRDPTLSPQSRQQMQRDGIKIHGMGDIRAAANWPRAVENVVKDVRRGAQRVYISFDISAIDPAYAPAAGRPVPGGLTISEAKELVRTLCAETNVAGFDMLDVAPALDPTYTTTMNANSVMHSCLTGIAQRKLNR